MFQIRYVIESDTLFWLALDKHISENELQLKIRDKRGYIINDDDKPVGILRYNLFWDNTPFLTLIYLEESYRGKGFGKQTMLAWEREMLELGHKMVMTSTQADEESQHFYRKLGYIDKGCLVMDKTPFEQPMEIIMIKVL